MRLQAALMGDLRQIMRDELRAAAGAISASMAEASAGLQADLREDTADALGQRVANAWRRRVYPEGRDSMDAAGWVYTRAPNIIRAYSEAQTIRSKNGVWLAIPGPGCPPKIGRAKPTPALVEEYYQLPLEFVYRPGRPALLVMHMTASVSRKTGQLRGFRKQTARRQAQGRGTVSVVMFILVPAIKTQKKVDVDAILRRWEARLPGLMVRNWERLSKSDFNRFAGY